MTKPEIQEYLSELAFNMYCAGEAMTVEQAYRMLQKCYLISGALSGLPTTIAQYGPFLEAHSYDHDTGLKRESKPKEPEREIWREVYCP